MAKKKGNAPQLSVLVKGLPLVNVLIGGIFLLGAWSATSISYMEDLPVLITLPICLMASGIVVLATHKTMRARERDWKFALEHFLKRFEKEDEEAKKSQEEGGQLFAVYYLGGHPNCKCSSDKDYGNLTVSEKQVTFRATRFNRFALKIARIKKVTIESEASLQVKKVKGINLKLVTAEERKRLSGRIKAEVHKRMKFLLFEYQDDLGEKLLIVFQPIGGNPLEAKTIKEAVDHGLNRFRLMRRKGGKSKPTDAFPPVQQAQSPPEPKKNTPRPSPSPVQRNTLHPSLSPVGSGALPSFELPTPNLVGPQIEAAPTPPPSKATGIFRTSDLLAAMKEQKYDVVLHGAKEERGRVANQMVEQFRLSPEQAQLVIEKVPYVAKKSVSYSEAELLASSFLAVGMQVTIDAAK